MSKKVEVEGVEVEVEDCCVDVTGLESGEWYIAKRNQPWQLLTCKSVDDRGWVVPVEPAYCFDTWECFKVIGVDL